MSAQMKVYFLFCMPNDAYEYMKMLLNVNKNAKIVIECELHANVRFLALMNASSRYWSSIPQMNAYFLVMNSKRCSVVVNNNNNYYYMANPVLGKSLCSDWFFLGQDFAVRTDSIETVQSVYFVLEQSRQIQNLQPRQRKKKGENCHSSH